MLGVDRVTRPECVVYSTLRRWWRGYRIPGGRLAKKSKGSRTGAHDGDFEASRLTKSWHDHRRKVADVWMQCDVGADSTFSSSSPRRTFLFWVKTLIPERLLRGTRFYLWDFGPEKNKLTYDTGTHKLPCQSSVGYDSYHLPTLGFTPLYEHYYHHYHCSCYPFADLFHTM